MATTEKIAATTYAVASAVASVTPKGPDSSQDRACTVLVPDGAAAVLCDGVGSYADSGAVAERCVSLASGHIGIEGVSAGLVSCAHAAAQLMDADDSLPDGATTLLAVGADLGGHAYFLLVGNGSIFALEPLSVRDGHAELLASELVIPHSVMKGSQAALRSFLPAPRTPLETSSGVLFPRDGRSRLLLACSDGITTLEEREFGRVPATGAVWARIDTPFVEVKATLEAIWSDLTSAPDAGDIMASALQSCLESICERGMLDDDATVAAVLVSPEHAQGDVGEGAA